MEEEDKERSIANISRKQSNTSNLEATEEVVNEIINLRSSGGKPLDASAKEFMESRFRHDFSNVRIHTDERATRTATSVNAFAYTFGNDVVFGKGEYRPSAIEGQKLLAHELTHVIQKRQSPEAGDQTGTLRIQRQPKPKQPAHPVCGPDATDWFIRQVNAAKTDPSVIAIQSKLSGAQRLATKYGFSAEKIAEGAVAKRVSLRKRELGRHRVHLRRNLKSHPRSPGQGEFGRAIFAQLHQYLSLVRLNRSSWQR